MRRILIIEDERSMARALELKLSHAGFEVKTAFDGESGLGLLEKESFDVAICDLMMPKKNGFQVLESLREKNISVPVMISTNLSQEDDEVRARELGAKEFFIKSNTPIADIVERITRFLLTGSSR